MSSLGSGELCAAIAHLRQRFDQHRKRKLDDYAPLSSPSADSVDDDDQDSFPLLKMHKLGSSSSSSAASDDHPSQLRPHPSSSSSSFSSSSSSSSSTLHFFVRLMSRNTVVIHAHPDDTVDSVIDQLQSITGIPTSEQRLLYRGRQLQGEATLAACAVENDASLQLTGRLRSTKYPRAWQIADDLIASICSLDTMGDDRVLATRTNVEGLIKRFLSLTCNIFETNREEATAHLEVFTLSGAPSALVKLYLSPVHENRLVATNAIKMFLQPNPEFLPEYIHVQCAPIVLKFCKILSGTVGKKDLQYVLCRSALASLLETPGGPEDGPAVHPVRRYLTHLKPLDIILELLGFISELTKLVLSGLSEEFMFIAQNVLEDLSNFLSAMRWAIQDWMGMEGPIARHLYNSKHPEYEDWIGSLHHLFIELLKMVDQGLKRVGDYMNQDGLERCESFLTMWPDMVAVLSVANVFAKMFEDAQQLLHALLLVRRIPVNFLLKHAKRNDKLRWFLKYKDVTDFEARRNLVLMLLPEWKDEDELHEMLIDRSQLLAESFEYISQADPMALHGGLFLEFKNEEATGPGVLREWFCLLCQAIFNPQNVLFLPCPDDRRRFFPNPASAVDPLHLKYFSFTGRVIALALMHKVQVGIVFDRVFFLQLAGKSVTLEDIKNADPCLYISCKQILDMDADLIDSDALGLTFVREINELGSRRTIELCPKGKDIVVNSKNREEYVNLLIQHHFVTSISEQVAHFAQGFADILSNSKHHKFFFQSLDLEDFDRMIGGSDSVINVKEWKAHTEYNGYKAKDRQICWFWKIVEEMSEEQRRILLFFWTSVKYLPVDGFRGLASKLYIYRSLTSQDSLPTSHTCFYRLCLPPYKSKSSMQDRLRLITREHVSCGFGFW